MTTSGASTSYTSWDWPAAVPDILEYYRTTRPQRLVITGAAGAGKTVLALELLLALLEDHKDN
ncbi:hypothetical protein ACFYW6_37315 [Streptomyces sp. NPDC002659]|uniref:hypothetical protein n=1 Tax=Streptomyces sp. NPDC002659 TaxID=3364656 RepID=UPI0036B17BDE